MEETRMDIKTIFIHVNVGSNAVELARGGAEPEDTEGIVAQLVALAAPITEGPSIQSKPLGFVRGLSLITSPASDSPFPNVAPSKENIFNTIDYDDGIVKGTIAQHGSIEFPPPFTESSELAIVGGTGDFRLVRGYSTPSLVSLSPVVIRLILHLFFSRASPSTSAPS
ncbi:hypothetical protein L7F22_025868 [Adiantum nelumboides]|nr:hypothetical protein [Adiantum nelumboides]MCO5572117.1 hypothetical protein [Adiantum nelumboides]